MQTLAATCDSFSSFNFGTYRHIHRVVLAI
jgi:hypothetical protein